MTAELFLKELKQIILSHPKFPSRIDYSENCENSNQIFYSKNLTDCFDCVKCSDSLYLYDSYQCKNCLDCDYAVESELCYESVDPFKSFNCEYLENCANMRDSSYCYACNDCSDVFGCVLLRHKSFCMFNRQLSEAEYREKINKFKTLSPEKILKIVEELKKHYPLTQTNESHNENALYGNYIYYSKNCYLNFDATHNQNSAYLYDSHNNNTSLDFTYSAYSELSYECVDSVRLFNCNYAVYSADSQDSSYIFSCTSVKNCLGCVNLNHKQYFILNRQFSKEEYEKISKPFFEELKQKNLGWENLTY